MTKSVVITGVSGSLGSFLARRLTAKGVEVIGISRTPFNHPGVEHLAIDLADPAANLPFLGSVPVINCAAITRDGWSDELETRTQAMTAAALALTKGGFVHVSSSSVYDLTKPSINQSELDVQRGHRFLNSYSYAKWMAEEQVLGSGRQAVVLRPHAIYGEGDNVLLPRLRAAVRGNALLLPSGGRVLHSLTSMDNVAGAVEAALGLLGARSQGLGSQRAGSGVTIANVTDAAPRVLADVIGEALRPSVRIRSVPVGVALWAAKRAERRTPEGTEPRLSEYAVRQLAFERTYDLTVLREVLGFEPA